MSTKLSQFLVDAPPPSMKVLMFDVYNLLYKSFFVSYYEFKKHKTAYQQGIEDKKYTEEEMFNYLMHLFLNSFFSTIRRVKPQRVIMAIEGSDRCWRKDLYEEYKANRKHDDLEVDWDQVKNKMITFINDLSNTFKNIYFISEPKTEADDVIAVLTKELVRENEIELISNDSDFYQLQINKNFKQYSLQKQEYLKSINPKLDLEVKIMTGDGDNIKPIFKRCGPKTAVKVINEGLEEYLKDPEIKKNYEINIKLVDFNYIPQEYQDKILNKFKEYQISKLEPAKVYNFLISNQLVKHSEDWQINFQYIKGLN